MPSPRTPSSLGIRTALTLGLLQHTGTQPKAGSPVLLSPRPWGASFSFCQQRRCSALPTHLDFRGHWAWSLYTLVPVQLRSWRTHTAAWRSAPVDREGTHSDFPPPCLLRPVAAQVTCVQGPQVWGRGRAMTPCSETKRLPASLLPSPLHPCCCLSHSPCRWCLGHAEPSHSFSLSLF